MHLPWCDALLLTLVRLGLLGVLLSRLVQSSTNCNALSPILWACIAVSLKVHRSEAARHAVEKSK